MAYVLRAAAGVYDAQLIAFRFPANAAAAALRGGAGDFKRRKEGGAVACTGSLLTLYAWRCRRAGRRRVSSGITLHAAHARYKRGCAPIGIPGRASFHRYIAANH